TPNVAPTKGDFQSVDAQSIRKETLSNFNENRNVINDNFISFCASRSEILPNRMVSHQPKKRSGGRKPREEETQLPPEEEERRRLRRLRNKEAAARCRKKRLDQMTTLEMNAVVLTAILNTLRALN
uniref:BZIP domain-containing protein n=1 Tax=Romanomermis culicivorax TaxID=13658 RepID=A0A915JYZ1_ROMCU